jgi:hypothetical protein
MSSFSLFPFVVVALLLVGTAWCDEQSSANKTPYCYCWVQATGFPRLSFDFNVSSCTGDACSIDACNNRTQLATDVALDGASASGAICSTERAPWVGKYAVSSVGKFSDSTPHFLPCNQTACCCPTGDFEIVSLGVNSTTNQTMLTFKGQVAGQCGARPAVGSGVVAKQSETWLVIKPDSWAFEVNTMTRSGQRVLVWGADDQCTFVLDPPSNNTTLVVILVILVIIVLAAGAAGFVWYRKKRAGFNRV